MMKEPVKRILTARQRLFAKLRYEDELPNPELAQKCGIADRTIYEWDKNPLIQEEIKRLAEADTRKAQRILERGSIAAAKALMELVEKDNWRKLFNQEIARKAACDILQAAGIAIKPKENQEEGVGSNPIFIIQTDGSQPKTEDKTKEFSKRFSLS